MARIGRRALVLALAALFLLSLSGAGTGNAADLTIRVDIKPLSHPNAVNLKNEGVIPVALFGTASFDVTQIDLSTTCLVIQTASGCLPGSYAQDASINPIDLNSNGYNDVVLHFDTQSTGTPPSNKKQQRTLCVRGSLVGGLTFEGCTGIFVGKS